MNNRIVMAPMTRSRTLQPGDIPSELNARYYAQRANCGLIISEATQISQQGKGYAMTPGIYSDEQIAGWRLVTNAVHQSGGKIFLQLWHVGRVSHPKLQSHCQLPVAPSAIKPCDTQVYLLEKDGTPKFVDCEIPRALETDEISKIVDDFRQAARNAIKAGFDGVEIHGANGYLIDQFLRSNSNHRSDGYGGRRENRTRFLLEVAEAVAEQIGAERTGVRLSPYITFKDMNDPEIIDTILLAARGLDKIGVAYVHLSEADWDDAPVIPDQFRHDLRGCYSGTVIVAGAYTRERADKIIDSRMADMVAFGRPFIANPDFPYRLLNNLPLATPDPNTFFGGGEAGYTDYKPYSKTKKPV